MAIVMGCAESQPWVPQLSPCLLSLLQPHIGGWGEEADGMDYSEKESFPVTFSHPDISRELVFKKYLTFWLGLAIFVFGMSWLGKLGG